MSSSPTGPVVNAGDHCLPCATGEAAACSGGWADGRSDAIDDWQDGGAMELRRRRHEHSGHQLEGTILYLFDES